MSPKSSYSNFSDDEDEQLRVKACQLYVVDVTESICVENIQLKSSRTHLQIIRVSDDERKEDQLDDQVGKKMASL